MIPQRTPVASATPDAAPVPTDLAQLLVVCPACSTTFCVESAAVAAMESPHFHCSRCDALFSLAAARSHQRALEQRTTSSAHSHRSSSPPPTFQHSNLLDDEDSTSNDVGDYNTGDCNLSVHDQGAGEFGAGAARTPASGASHPLVRRTTPHATLNAITEPRPRGTGSSHRLRSFSNGIKASEFSLGMRATPPQTRPAPPPTRYTPPSPTPHPAPVLHPEPSPAAQEELPFAHHTDTDLPESALFSCSDVGYTDVTVNTPLHPFNTDTSDDAGLNGDLPSAEHPTSARRSNKSSFWARCAPRTRGLICMSAPLVTTFAALIALSYSSRMSPLTIGATMRSIAPGFLSDTTPQLPPAGVNVRGVRLHFTKVATKEAVAFITGTVVNSTDTSMASVTLEGLGFNERGEVLITAQAPLRSALSREKPATLSFENIEKFQGSLSARSSEIGPHEEVPFTIALIPQRNANPTTYNAAAPSEVDLSQLRYFSARVFSVR